MDTEKMREKYSSWSMCDKKTNEFKADFRKALDEIDRLNDMSEWISVEDKLPKQGEQVLVACKSGYTSTEWHYESAHYDPEFRPKAPWLDDGGNGILEGWPDVEYWRPLLEQPNPKVGVYK